MKGLASTIELQTGIDPMPQHCMYQYPAARSCLDSSTQWVISFMRVSYRSQRSKRRWSITKAYSLRSEW